MKKTLHQASVTDLLAKNTTDLFEELPFPPLLTNKRYDATSVFTPENLLREARRQKGLAFGQVPSICVLAVIQPGHAITRPFCTASYSLSPTLRTNAVTSPSRTAPSQRASGGRAYTSSRWVLAPRRSLHGQNQLSRLPSR